MNNILTLVVIVLLLFLPLWYVKSKHEEPSTVGKHVEASSEASGTGEPKELFSGADTQAEAMINKINPEYKPWFSSIWTPPSGEIESLLFALQAALGAGILFYYLGYVRGRKDAIAKMESNNASH